MDTRDLDTDEVAEIYDERLITADCGAVAE